MIFFFRLYDRFTDFIWGFPGLVLMLSLLVLVQLAAQAVPYAPTQSDSPFVILPITLTAYSPSKAQTDSNPFETASGQIMTTVDLEHQLFVAASRDLLTKFTPGAPLKYGDKIYIEFTVIDTMHERWTNRIDVFCRNQRIAEYIGHQPNRNIIILKE